MHRFSGVILAHVVAAVMRALDTIRRHGVRVGRLLAGWLLCFIVSHDVTLCLCQCVVQIIINLQNINIHFIPNSQVSL